MLKFKTHDASFISVFYIWSLFFLIYFILIPYFIILNVDNVYFLNESLDIDFNPSLVASCIFIFILGFVFFDFFNKLFSLNFKFYESRVSNGKVNFLFYFLLIAFIAHSVYIILFSDTEFLYSVRRGESSVGRLDYFLTVFIGSIKLVVMVIIFSRPKSFLAFLFLFFSFYAEFVSSIGRTNLIFNLSLLLIYSLNLSAFRFSLISLFGFFLCIPIVLSLKTFVYYISVHGYVPDLSIIIDNLDYSIYLNNFGHVIVSLINAPNLIDDIGYRYFYDFFQGFIFYFRVFGFDTGDSLTYLNTKSLLGVQESILPPGYLAFGFVQLHYLGVFLMGMFYRFIGFIASIVYHKINVNSEVVKFLLCFIAANTFYHGDLRIIVLSFFLPIFMLLFVRRLFYVNFRVY